jgi:hypothetical protein
MNKVFKVTQGESNIPVTACANPIPYYPESAGICQNSTTLTGRDGALVRSQSVQKLVTYNGVVDVTVTATTRGISLNRHFIAF